MNTLRGNVIYTVFATIAFVVILYIGDERDVTVLAFSALMFFGFTLAMLRLMNRVMAVVIGGMGKKRHTEEPERGPAVIEPRTARPDHVRRRRDRRRRR